MTPPAFVISVLVERLLRASLAPAGGGQDQLSDFPCMGDEREVARIQFDQTIAPDLERWPASNSTVVAFMRAARNRSRSGAIV